MGPNVGLLSTRSNALVCTSHHAYSVALFDRHHLHHQHHQCENNADNSQGLIRTKFESQACSVALIHPYLIVFSPSVIEIRDIETVNVVISSNENCPRLITEIIFRLNYFRASEEVKYNSCRT